MHFLKSCLFYYICTHVRNESLGDRYGTVLVLEIFKDRCDRSSDRKTGAVQGMNILRLVLGVVLEADVCAARLIVLEVRA